ncbi:unnamed protein product [Umbelopsis ramanniana]
MAKVANTPIPNSFPEPTFSYDVHIYFNEKDEKDVQSASDLRDEIIQKFGHLEDLRVYKLHTKPIGPHPIGMFECDLKQPATFATFVPWIQLYRRGHSVLVHPRHGDALKEHTTDAIWIGEKQPLLLDILRSE